MWTFVGVPWGGASNYSGVVNNDNFQPMTSNDLEWLFRVNIGFCADMSGFRPFKLRK